MEVDRERRELTPGADPISMKCQDCKKNVATVHVTEIVEHEEGEGKAKREVSLGHLCEVCAERRNLPHSSIPKHSVAEIWKLLQYSAQQTKRRPNITCPRCELNLDEFRRKGRLGCSQCYETFEPHLMELFERVHNAAAHVGRIPGISEDELHRQQQMTDLQQELEIAIREEAYESAAKIRDQLKSLEGAQD